MNRASNVLLRALVSYFKTPALTKISLTPFCRSENSIVAVGNFANRIICVCGLIPVINDRVASYIRRRILFLCTAVLNIFCGLTAEIFVPTRSLWLKDLAIKRGEWVILPFSITLLNSATESLCDRGNMQIGTKRPVCGVPWHVDGPIPCDQKSFSCALWNHGIWHASFSLDCMWMTCGHYSL